MAKKSKTTTWSFRSLRLRVESLEKTVARLEKQVAKFTSPSLVKRIFGKKVEISDEYLAADTRMSGGKE